MITPRVVAMPRATAMLLMACALSATFALTTAVDARGGFGGMRVARMNFSGGGLHGGGAFNVPHDPIPHPQPGGGGLPNPHRPLPPHPHPPGPHPPPPRPHPRPPPPRPVPVPYWPGYWHDEDDAWAGAVAGLAIGTLIASAPSGCQPVTVADDSYLRCGSTWLKPEYQGHKIVYAIVADPR